MLVVLLGLVARRGGREPGPLPSAGVAVVIATCLALRQLGHLPNELVLGLALLVGGVILAGALPHAVPAAMALAAPGAWVIATQAGVAPIGWIQTLVAIVVVGGGALVAAFDQRWSAHGYGPVLLAVTTLGVYVTIPDTERALVLVGAALPLAFASWPRPIASLGRAGSYAATAMVAWVVATGGVGRHSSIVGGVACLGILVVEPIVRALGRGRTPLEALERVRQAWLRPVGAALVHAVLVAVAARAAGLRVRLQEGVAIVVAELALSLLIGVAVARRSGPGAEAARR